MNTTNRDKSLRKKVLVTGVTGYLGARLVPQLLREGLDVAVLVRGAKDRLKGRSWYEQVDVHVGDVLKPETLPDALKEVSTAYYLIHSMKDGETFRERDRKAARNFAQAAANAGTKRIVYMGGLGDSSSDDLSAHLESRQEIGRILAGTDVPVIEFRAAIIVGSGSVSFEMIRHLVERLPVLLSPPWVDTKIQPIRVDDALDYLVTAAMATELDAGIYEIGGATVLTYRDMLLEYGRLRGLKRKAITLPFITPTLSAYGVHLLTPISVEIAEPLIKGLKNEVVVTNNRAKKAFPEIVPVNYEMAVLDALENIHEGNVASVWSDAFASSQDDEQIETFTEEQGMFIERRERTVNATPQQVFQAFTSLGGEHGWPPHNTLWVIRGLLDRLVGGSGLRRGRRDPKSVRVGDALDFWRVEAVEKNKRLLLRAEMKVPGKAWLEFVTCENDKGETVLTQTAFFASKGLFGLLYWYGLVPLHALVFPGMINNVAKEAEALARDEQPTLTGKEKMIHEV